MFRILLEIKEALENAKRIGGEIDIPEGIRYIQISDTLARKWIDDIINVTPKIPPEIIEGLARGAEIIREAEKEIQNNLHVSK